MLTPAEARRSVTDATWRTLARALDLEERFDGAGIFPQGSSQHRHFRRLVAAGYLVRTGYGVDLDRDRDDEVLIFHLTDAGRALARLLETDAPPPAPPAPGEERERGEVGG